MKNIKYVIITFITFMIGMLTIEAAPTYSIGTSSSTVENGKNVTASITVKNTAAWNIKIISSGNTTGCTNSWADATGNGNNATKTFTTTCKATALGSISFTFSGDITSSDGANINISGSKRVTVVEPRPASTINTLKGLEVTGYELTPEFDEERLEYSVTVPSTVNKVNIKATKKDTYSKVDGGGEVEVFEGANRFEINVTSESGSIRTYVVTINVEDQNPINVSINGKNYTVVKNSRNIEIPNDYIEGTVEINGVAVPAFTNEITNITLVALKDETGLVKFFRYNEGSYELYLELSSNSQVLIPVNIPNSPFKNFKIVEINISDNTITALQYKNLDKYYIIYAMNVNNGENNYYLYDSINNTYQVFNEELYNSLVSDSNFYLYMLCGAAGLILICIIIIVSLLSKKSKKVVSPKEEKKEEQPEIEKKKTKKELLSEDTTRINTFDDIKISDMKKKK